MDEFIEEINKGSKWIYKYGAWSSRKVFPMSLWGKDQEVLAYLDKKKVFPAGGTVKLCIYAGKVYIQWHPGTDKDTADSVKHASKNGIVRYEAMSPSTHEDDTDTEE